MAQPCVDFEFHCLSLALAGVREAAAVAMALPAGTGLLAAIVDPVGQGQTALVVGRKGAQPLLTRPGVEIGDLFNRVHRALAGLGGVSLGAARIDPRRGRVQFAGIGRVYGAVVSATAVEVLSPIQGTVGVGLPKAPLVVTVPWRPGDLLVLAVDGPVDAWDLTKVRTVVAEPFEVIARRIAGASARLPEDASLVLARQRP